MTGWKIDIKSQSQAEADMELSYDDEDTGADAKPELQEEPEESAQ